MLKGGTSSSYTVSAVFYWLRGSVESLEFVLDGFNFLLPERQPAYQILFWTAMAPFIKKRQIYRTPFDISSI